MGIGGVDMNYEIAKEMGVNVTYGFLITEIDSEGPAAKTNLQKKDIIIEVNGTRIKDGDDLSTYLERNTYPYDTIILTVVRGNQILQIPLTLERRPPPSV